MNSSPNFDDGAVVAVASLTADAVASQLETMRNRLPSLLPSRCLLEIDGEETPKCTDQAMAMERLVMCQAAVAALGQSSRSLCDQQDELNRLHDYFVREARPRELTGADRVARRLSGLALRTDGELRWLLGRLTWARMQGLRFVLLAQLDRESYTRGGRPIPVDVKLPVGSGSGGGDQELELVPVEPKDPESGGKGGSGGAAPAVVVMATVPPDSLGPGADADDDDEDDASDGLDFLDIDRKG